MSVVISEVARKSPAAKKGIKSGYILNKINSHEINDVLDYQFFADDEKLVLELSSPSGSSKTVHVKKRQGEDLGLEFETYLMDRQQRCRNGCIFCFIDQLPPDMRSTLYFKDDDSRLSFLFGNYITLTNLSQHDADRIIQMHISPVNVSVHTMNPELRVKMMNNKNAGTSLLLLERFAKAGIKLNTQLVLCPGINDGDELEYSLSKLSQLYPAVQSIAAVPVGLTKFRKSLFPLEEYTAESARRVIDTVEAFSREFSAKNGTRLAFCADEFYLKAGLPMPEDSFYEDYPQLDNGVGLWTSLETEFYEALDRCEVPQNRDIKVSMATGTAAYPLIKKLSEAVKNRYENAEIDVYEIKNDFFGHSITVSGLITGGDLIRQLGGKALHRRLLIPSVMLKSGTNLFLDDVTTEQVESRLGVKLTAVSNDGYELLDSMLGLI